jgi:hypothetical protein
MLKDIQNSLIERIKKELENDRNLESIQELLCKQFYQIIKPFQYTISIILLIVLCTFILNIINIIMFMTFMKKYY